MTTLCYSQLYVTQLINNWAYQWKLSFNPEPSKQAVEVVSQKEKMYGHGLLVRGMVHPPIFFNRIEVTRVDEQKHLGLMFEKHIISKSQVARKNISILKHLYPYLPLTTLDQLYWQGTSRNILYEELGRESLPDRWSRRLLQFYKICNNMTPICLLDDVPRQRRQCKLFSR